MKPLALKRGSQDCLDFISYDRLLEKQDYLKIDNRFCRTLFISGYPFTAYSGFLNSLLNFSANLDISYHLEQIPAEIALPKLTRKITELESTKRQRIKNGQTIGPEIDDPLTSASELRDKLQRGQEMLFQVAIYVCLSAASLKELNQLSQLLKSSLSSQMVLVRSARYRQVEGLQSVLPRAQDKLGQKRNLDSSAAALTFPFSSCQLVQPGGILYGVNQTNQSLVILDRFALNNANSIVFAQSGAGKSYITKVEILRQLMLGTQVIVIDPEREYQQLAKNLGADLIEISTNSDRVINPFDIRSQLSQSETVQTLMEIIEVMVEGLGPLEKTSLDKALIAIYEANPRPRLEDLYHKLNDLGAHDLGNRLERFLFGSLAGVFNRGGNLNLAQAPLIVFDIKDMPANLHRLMMLVIASFVWAQVKQKPIKRLLIIDEAWLLLAKQQSAEFMTSLVRRARKYYLGVSLISQQASDFLDHDQGRVIAAQSSLRILMRQDSTTIKAVAQQFGLSQRERQFLLTCERGQALILADKHHVSLQVVASEAEHPLITTDPAEVYQ